MGCVCVCVCVCFHTYMYMYVNTHIYIYTHRLRDYGHTVFRHVDNHKRLARTATADP